MTGFAKRTIRDVDPSGKKVLVRVDFNVPLADGAVADDSRIKAALPTIQHLRRHGAAIALCSHLGRPKGTDPKLSLAPVARRLGELLGRDVPLLPDSVGPAVRQAVDALRPGDLVLLENVPSTREEEKNHRIREGPCGVFASTLTTPSVRRPIARVHGRGGEAPARMTGLLLGR